MKELIKALIAEQESLNALEAELKLQQRKLEIAEEKVRSLKQQLVRELPSEKCFLVDVDGKSYVIQVIDKQLVLLPIVAL